MDDLFRSFDIPFRQRGAARYQPTGEDRQYAARTEELRQENDRIERMNSVFQRFGLPLVQQSVALQSDTPEWRAARREDDAALEECRRYNDRFEQHTKGLAEEERYWDEQTRMLKRRMHEAPYCTHGLKRQLDEDDDAADDDFKIRGMARVNAPRRQAQRPAAESRETPPAYAPSMREPPILQRRLMLHPGQPSSASTSPHPAPPAHPPRPKLIPKSQRCKVTGAEPAMPDPARKINHNNRYHQCN